MTDNDIQLIDEARRIHYTAWWQVDDMAAEADTDEARAELHRMAMDLYHQYEYQGGLE